MSPGSPAYPQRRTGSSYKKWPKQLWLQEQVHLDITQSASFSISKFPFDTHEITVDVQLASNLGEDFNRSALVSTVLARSDLDRRRLLGSLTAKLGSYKLSNVDVKVHH